MIDKWWNRWGKREPERPQQAPADPPAAGEPPPAVLRIEELEERITVSAFSMPR